MIYKKYTFMNWNTLQVHIQYNQAYLFFHKVYLV